MTKIISVFIVALLITTQSYSQCACCAGAGTGSLNGDYKNGVLTLNKKQFVVEGYADYRTIKSREENYEPSDTASGEETPLKSMLISSLGLRYGITKKITVSALLPYAFLYTDNGNDNGIGDLILLGTFNVYSKKSFNLALQAGVELPTGIQKGANFDNTTVVLGSGSVDPMAGVMFSKRWNKITLQGNALYKHTTQGFENTNFGSVAVQNLSVAYRIKGESTVCSVDTSKRPGHSDFAWTFFGGYYGEWLNNIKRENVVDENSGYYLGFTILGTNISYGKWNFPFTVSLPVIQQMNGDQNNAGFRLRLGVIKSF